jgi:hypothetical protein
VHGVANSDRSGEDAASATHAASGPASLSPRAYALVNAAINAHFLAGQLEERPRAADDEDPRLTADDAVRSTSDALLDYLLELESDVARYREPFTGYESDEARDAYYGDLGIGG